MKGFGTFALIIGICWLVFALSMDVSVATGAGGRVNNMGLMADRQIHTIVGGMIALAGLLMILLGGKTAAPQYAAETDTRPCPLCAETIKRAAIKCKHCGGDVPPAPSAQAPLTSGWTVQVECEPWAHAEATKSVKRLGFPTTKGSAKFVSVGPFGSEAEALVVRDNIRSLSDLRGEIHIVAPGE
ncbi:SPOR domain-containing protein [Pseudomonas rhodesiae]|uniref:SPOR domain-containing protein n=1 Tax=Pseudomonas rhodesiae TaxID=76760 RepID=UPI00209F5B75|nr:hypothetical protein [Pseudomonas rhodesiae]MCP1510981.1 hypothetical protein [Pseudomonas rhodesiae]MDF9769799.1 hypothetical protein [Pseudomonas rhodesiae]